MPMQAPRQVPERAFGHHLTLDGYGCSYEQLTNLDLIYQFLDHYVFKYHGKVPEDWGLSGFVLIAESHISIHTFPERRYLSLDIFSCKEFDHDQAVAYAAELFGITRYEKNLLDRGLEFPRDVSAVERHMRQERDDKPNPNFKMVRISDHCSR